MKDFDWAKSKGKDQKNSEKSSRACGEGFEDGLQASLQTEGT